MKILYRVDTGSILAVLKDNQKIGDMDEKNVAKGVWSIYNMKEEETQKETDIKKGKIIIKNNSLTYLPEEDWPENQKEEEIELDHSGDNTELD